MTNWRYNTLINVGLWGPPLIWAATLQVGQILPYVDCRRGSHSLAITAFSALVLAVLAGMLAWRITGHEELRREYSFLAALSGLSSAVFAFALALQFAATLVLTGCER